MITIKLTKNDTASANGITVKGRGMAGPIGPLARKLLESGESPFAPVRVFSGTTLCFPERDLIHWASVHTTESANASVKTVVYSERPAILEAAE